jgi:Mechanosensitive ion channel MscS, C-terminal
MCCTGEGGEIWGTCSRASPIGRCFSLVSSSSSPSCCPRCIRRICSRAWVELDCGISDSAAASVPARRPDQGRRNRRHGTGGGNARHFGQDLFRPAGHHPNSEIYTRSVTVNTAYDVRRSEVTVPVGLETPLELVIRTFQNAVREVPDVLTDPPPDLLPWEFKDNNVNVLVRWWTKPQRAYEVRTRAGVMFRGECGHSRLPPTPRFHSPDAADHVTARTGAAAQTAGAGSLLREGRAGSRAQRGDRRQSGNGDAASRRTQRRRRTRATVIFAGRGRPPRFIDLSKKTKTNRSPAGLLKLLTARSRRNLRCAELL